MLGELIYAIVLRKLLKVSKNGTHGATRNYPCLGQRNNTARDDVIFTNLVVLDIGLCLWDLIKIDLEIEFEPMLAYNLDFWFKQLL